MKIDMSPEAISKRLKMVNELRRAFLSLANSSAGKEILEQALKLKPEERFIIVEGLIKSLDEPDSTIDAIWVEEAEKRLQAYRAG